MNHAFLLSDPKIILSVAWEVLKDLLGPTVSVWEPESVRIALSQRGIEPTDSLMAKLLAAQTIETNNSWSYDHDVFFAFCLACDGIPADGESLHYPTPEQLCWGVSEIEHITKKQITDDEGFDPDHIDAAIACLLQLEGYVVCPDKLSFAQDLLNKASSNYDKLREAVLESWKNLKSLKNLHEKIDNLPETEKNIQLKRLTDCYLYELEKNALREQQLRSWDKHL